MTCNATAEVAAWMLAICPALDSARAWRQKHAAYTARLFKEVLQLVPFHTRRKVPHEDLGNAVQNHVQNVACLVHCT